MRERMVALMALCCAGLMIVPSQAINAAEANETARARTAREWYDLGISRVLKSDYAGAIEAYAKAVELNPGDFQWWRSLGDAQSDAGNHAAAIDAYRKMLVLNPAFAFGCKLLAKELGSSGSRDEAIHCFEEAIFRGQGDAFSASSLETYNSYRQSIGLASTTEADVVIGRNRRTAAVAAVAPKRLSKAQTQAQIQALLAEAQQLTSARDYGKAFGKYREASALDPTRADLHAAIGKAKLDSAFYDQQMVAELREAARLDPGNAAYHEYLGNALSLMRQYPQAIAAQREAIRLAPTAERFALLGRAQSGAGDLQAAIESYRKAITLDPENAHRHAALGDELRRANRPQEAMAAYQRALQIIPSATPWRTSYDELRAATTSPAPGGVNSTSVLTTAVTQEVPELLPSSTATDLRYSDGSRWKGEPGELRRIHPAPVLNIIVLGPHYTSIKCAQGRRSGYPLHPSYAPAGFSATPEHQSRAGETEVDVCTDLKAGVLDLRLRWPGVLSPADAKSITGPLSVLRNAFLNAAAEGRTITLFSPAAAKVTLDAGTGDWNELIDDSKANETVVIPAWPAEPFVLLRLIVSPKEQSCSTTGLERSLVSRPSWLPATFYEKAGQKGDQLVVCRQLGNRLLMAQIAWKDTHDPADDQRLGALLGSITAIR